MKNIVVILAGGISKRMGADIPKQFLMLRDKPVIVHTLENFQKHPNIDGILIVCVKAWIQYLSDLVKQYNLDKVQWVVEGGDTVHDSTRNALFYLKDILAVDDYVIIHDAARPLLPQSAISNMLSTAYKYGNASLAIPSHETLIFTENHKQKTWNNVGFNAIIY